jgi:nucleoside 2-deoxyribosyltransferase
MKIYLAARYDRRNEMEEYAFELESRLKQKVVSTWHCLLVEPNIELEKHSNKMKQAAERDLEDLNKADCLILFSDERGSKNNGGGKDFEAGYAYGKGLEIISIGPYENVFHFLEDVERYETFEHYVSVYF